jgi:hypothetical protein
MNTVQIQNMTAEEMFSNLNLTIQDALKKVSPDIFISQKRAALIAEKTPQTILNWEKAGILKNHSSDNQLPKYSLYELLTIIQKK